MPQQDAQHHHRTLARGVRTIFSVTLLSRCAGLVRDVIVGRIFGNTALSSAFQAAFQFPNLFRRLFGEGALSAAFLPAYTETLKDGPEKIAADRFATLTMMVLATVTSVLTVVAEIVLFILLLVLPSNPERELSLKLVMVMLPFMPLICSAAILAGMLQVHGRYGASSAGPLLLNLFITTVGGYFLLTGEKAGAGIAYLLGAATVLSGVTQCLWYLRILKKYVSWRFDYATAAPRARTMLKRFVPVAIGLGALQLSTFLDTLIAMYPIWVGPTIFGFAYPLDETSNGVLSLTSRLYQFPLGVFGIAVATAVFPLLAKTASEPDRFVEVLRRGIRLSLFIGIPASVGLFLVRHHITFVMFSGGDSGFDAVGVAKSAAVLAGYSGAIWAYSLNHVFARALYARGDTRTPMRISLGAVVLSLVLNLTLIWWLAEAGMALATSIGATAQCMVMAYVVRRALKNAPGGAAEPRSLTDADARLSIIKIVASSAAMGGVVLGVLSVMPPATTWTGHFIALLAGTAAGIIAYGGIVFSFRLPELSWLVRGR